MSTPNTYGQYPAGALELAQNAVMRAPGEMWSAPGFGLQQAFGGGSDIVRKIYPLDSSHVYTYSRNAGGVWTLTETGNAVGLPPLFSTTNLFNDGGRIWPIRMRERMLVSTATTGVVVGDFMAPSTAPQRSLRSAGMQQPLITLIGGSGVGPGTLPGGVMVGYSVLLKRVFSDDYEVVSVPSPIYKYPGTGITVNPTLRIDYAPLGGGFGGVQAGDILEIYRTDGLVTADVNADPGDTLKLINSITLSGADATSGFIQMIDTTIMQAPLYQTIGRELYTNPFQETSLQANRQPNIALAMAQFKGYAFYGDITERPRWTFQVPAGFGNTSNAAQNTDYFRLNGIGTRHGSGVITLGSAVITGVSAAQIQGIKQGQFWVGGAQWIATYPFPAPARVLSVNAGAGTITMNTIALANGATFFLADAIKITGAMNDIRVADLGDLVASMGQAIGGLFEITVDQAIPNTASAPYSAGATVTIEPTRWQYFSSLIVSATNGPNYQGPVPEYPVAGVTFARTRNANLLQYSKNQQPEHVPAANEEEVGAAQLISMMATKNALWIFCTDGLYRLSGDGPPWRLELFDPGCILCAPQALVQMRDSIWAYTNYGIVRIDDNGLAEITAQTLNELFFGPPYSENPGCILERNETDDEIVVVTGNPNPSSLLYVFNTKQKGWTWISAGAPTNNITAMAFQRSATTGLQRLLVATSTPLSQPNYSTWGVAGVNYLAPLIKYQPFYGDDPLTMKQFVDATYMFNLLDGTGAFQKDVQATSGGANMGNGLLIVHNNDAYLTVGVTRDWAIAQSYSPGYSHIAYNSQSKFRGVSLRFVPTSNTAWRL